MRNLSGTSAVVTGAASGIGLATARVLAQRGCSLELVDINAELLGAAADEIRTGKALVRTHVCDLSSGDSIDELCARLTANAPPAILVNNAGVAYHDRFERMQPEQWERVMRVNLDAPARLVMGLLPAMRTLPEAHIVNVASVLGHIPKRKLTAYCASKFGLVGFSLALRAELSPKIGVSAVCPGLIKTAMAENALSSSVGAVRHGVPQQLAASPERVANAVFRAIRTNKRLIMVTGHARAARAVHTIAPGVLDLLQMRRNAKRQRNGQIEASSASS